MTRTHRYAVTTIWTGNTGTGTSAYDDYARSHEIRSNQPKPAIPGSADPMFRGDQTRWNPDELLVAALSACHQLWYLHLCADAGIVVTAYLDHAEGELDEAADGAGRFRRVILRPEVVLAPGADAAKALALHREAHAKCFVANSVNFPVEHEPRIVPTLE
jgi:organic hydroperoxide reductase OsmC/OhrA